MSETTKAPKEQERHLAEIEALQRDYDQAESEYEQAKDEAAALKKTAEQKARKLFEYIRSLNAPLPLFEVWRQCPISELGLPDVIVSILEENGLATVGALADWTAKGKRLTDIPHIGEHKAGMIEEALERFWKRRKDEGQA